MHITMETLNKRRMVTVGSAPNLNLIWRLILPHKVKRKNITQTKFPLFPVPIVKT